MIATVRLDNHLEKILNNLTNNLHKKKSDIIREAIELYALNLEKNKENRILQAIKKTKEADKKLNNEFETVVSDAL